MISISFRMTGIVNANTIRNHWYPKINQHSINTPQSWAVCKSDQEESHYWGTIQETVEPKTFSGLIRWNSFRHWHKALQLLETQHWSLPWEHHPHCKAWWWWWYIEWFNTKDLFSNCPVKAQILGRHCYVYPIWDKCNERNYLGIQIKIDKIATWDVIKPTVEKIKMIKIKMTVGKLI